MSCMPLLQPVVSGVNWKGQDGFAEFLPLQIERTKRMGSKESCQTSKSPCRTKRNLAYLRETSWLKMSYMNKKWWLRWSWLKDKIGVKMKQMRGFLVQYKGQ